MRPRSRLRATVAHPCAADTSADTARPRKTRSFCNRRKIATQGHKAATPVALEQRGRGVHPCLAFTYMPVGTASMSKAYAQGGFLVLCEERA